MQKRTAITTAAAIAMTAAAGGSALAVSLGVFAEPEREVVGSLTAEPTPTTSSTTSTTVGETDVSIETIYVDSFGNPIDPPTGGAPAASPAGSAPASPAASTASVSPPAAQATPPRAPSAPREYEGEYDNDEEHEEHEEHEEEDEGDEYEGAEDDD